MYVCFEGIDGAGKSTLIAAVAQVYAARGKKVQVTREPGGSEFGGSIRQVVQHMEAPLDSRAEFLLYAADRAQHYAQCVHPAQAQGVLLLSDRSFISSLAYQGYGRGLDLDVLKTVNRWALHNTLPDLFVYLKLSPEKAFERLHKRAEPLTRFETEKHSFFQKVAAGYDQLFTEYGPVLIVDAQQSPDAVLNAVITYIDAHA